MRGAGGVVGRERKKGKGEREDSRKEERGEW